jgi:RNA polymerase sigma-70 factor (ECF subfamily)
MDSLSNSQVLRRISADGDDAIAEFFSQNRERLVRMVSFRMHPRLRGRVDPDDIVQEGYLDAVQRIHHFTDNPVTSIFVWFRLVVAQTLQTVHRSHLGTQMRDANREQSRTRRTIDGDATAASITALVVGHLTSPSQAAVRDERAKELREALDGMSSLDQEVLALRHFEELSNNEAAEELGITAKAASVRYFRAVRRLKGLLENRPDFQ